MDSVWIVEYFQGNSGKGMQGHKAFRNKDDAYKAKFEVDYDFFTEELKSDIELDEKCKDPEYAKKQYHNHVTDDTTIHLCERALAHLERVKNDNVSWEEKNKKLWADAIPWSDDPDSGLVNLGSTCCTNLAPGTWIYELKLE